MEKSSVIVRDMEFEYGKPLPRWQLEMEALKFSNFLSEEISTKWLKNFISKLKDK